MAASTTVRPPAVPLIVHDPYFSVWSFADGLTDEDTRHWTGTRQQIHVFLRVDGQVYRLAGADRGIPALPQTSLQVYLTSTRYHFAGAGVQVELAFTTPALPEDMDLLARPVSYLSWEVSASDGQPHQCELCVGISAEMAVNEPAQGVLWGRHRLDGLQVLSCSHDEQPVLARAGDNLRIDWGTLYLAVPEGAAVQTWAGMQAAGVETFVATGGLPVADDLDMPRQVQDGWLQLWASSDLGRVGDAPCRGRAMVAYDVGYAIEYLQRKLRPYWRRNGMGVAELLTTAHAEADTVLARCRAYDAAQMDTFTNTGGPGYAQLCALAFRQCLAAHTLCADVDGTPLYFSKENFSNGCVATVDVTFPSSPFFLLYQPELLRAMLTPVLDYALTPRWRFPFAPHDLGTYPLANGQVYGGGERTEVDQMPVEECGNMLLLMAGLARVTGDCDYVQCYWPLLTQWSEYLRGHGLDPAEQLCTDDFAGHLGHNANLAIKAILALGGYAQMAEMLGDAETARSYHALAAGWVQEWMRMADDGDHYRLAFDRPGTWSQKYNLVWDRLLDLHLFPAAVVERELAYYLTQQQRYGLPLDSRKTYTKLDWILWTASLCTRDEDFAALVEPVVRWLGETPSRVPLTDWYDTVSGAQIGFQARSVVGGLFLPLLLRRDR